MDLSLGSIGDVDIETSSSNIGFLALNSDNCTDTCAALVLMETAGSAPVNRFRAWKLTNTPLDPLRNKIQTSRPMCSMSPMQAHYVCTWVQPHRTNMQVTG